MLQLCIQKIREKTLKISVSETKAVMLAASARKRLLHEP